MQMPTSKQLADPTWWADNDPSGGQATHYIRGEPEPWRMVRAGKAYAWHERFSQWFHAKHNMTESWHPRPTPQPELFAGQAVTVPGPHGPEQAELVTAEPDATGHVVVRHSKDERYRVWALKNVHPVDPKRQALEDELARAAAAWFQRALEDANIELVTNNEAAQIAWGEFAKTLIDEGWTKP